MLTTSLLPRTPQPPPSRTVAGFGAAKAGLLSASFGAIVAKAPQSVVSPLFGAFAAVHNCGLAVNGLGKGAANKVFNVVSTLAINTAVFGEAFILEPLGLKPCEVFTGVLASSALKNIYDAGAFAKNGEYLKAASVALAAGAEIAAIPAIAAWDDCGILSPSPDEYQTGAAIVSATLAGASSAISTYGAYKREFQNELILV